MGCSLFLFLFLLLNDYIGVLTKMQERTLDIGNALSSCWFSNGISCRFVWVL